MKDLLEARRFAVQAGHYPIVDFIDRWIALPEDAKERLRAKWAGKEVRGVDKTAAVPGVSR